MLGSKKVSSKGDGLPDIANKSKPRDTLRKGTSAYMDQKLGALPKQAYQTMPTTNNILNSDDSLSNITMIESPVKGRPNQIPTKDHGPNSIKLTSMMTQNISMKGQSGTITGIDISHNFDESRAFDEDDEVFEMHR